MPGFYLKDNHTPADQSPCLTCDALRDLVPLVQFKNREKHPWSSVTLSKGAAEACTFTKSNTPPRVFFTFSKLYKW